LHNQLAPADQFIEKAVAVGWRPPNENPRLIGESNKLIRSALIHGLVARQRCAPTSILHAPRLPSANLPIAFSRLRKSGVVFSATAK
jgi:hypothetical protein